MKRVCMYVYMYIYIYAAALKFRVKNWYFKLFFLSQRVYIVTGLVECF